MLLIIVCLAGVAAIGLYGAFSHSVEKIPGEA